VPAGRPETVTVRLPAPLKSTKVTFPPERKARGAARDRSRSLDPHGARADVVEELAEAPVLVGARDTVVVEIELRSQAVDLPDRDPARVRSS